MRIKIQTGLILLMLIPAFALAGTTQLPQTGQTTCYNASGAVISCTGTGQDGELQTGVAWPDPRFTENGDQTVSDNLTGLIWAKDGNLMVSRDPGFDADGTASDGAVTWQHALDYVKKLNAENYLGHNDWRLPNVNELMTTASNPQKILASTSDLYGTFEGLGIWKWNGTAWSNLTSSIPDKMVTSGIKLYGAFSGLGIWLWTGTQWEQATPSNPQLIAASSTKLFGSFAGAGIWEWDGAATWKQISPDTPTQMTASGTELYAAFTGVGIKKWDGTTWSQISGNEPVKMVVGE